MHCGVYTAWDFGHFVVSDGLNLSIYLINTETTADLAAKSAVNRARAACNCLQIVFWPITAL
jgi:hypothetical protein